MKKRSLSGNQVQETIEGSKDLIPTVSVIILNYNGYDHLETCLLSLLDLEFPKEQLEIIIVDNGSTDNSTDLIQSKFPDIRLIRNETNLGFSRAANQGAASAKGEYLAFLNNDMRVAKNWLKALLQAIQREPEIGCIGSLIMNWDGTAIDFWGRSDDLFGLDPIPSNPPTPASVSSSNKYTIFASGGAMLIRKGVFQELGGFDVDYFMYHEDVDLGWRLWLRGYKCVLTPLSVVYHKGGASSGRLPREFVDAFLQKHVLFTVFKNLEGSNLAVLLPLIFYLLLDHGRWWLPAQKLLPEVTQEFRSSLKLLIDKRIEVQKTRVISDAEIFLLAGHPFNFLLRQQSYGLIRNEIMDCCSKVEFDLNDVEAAQTTITEWLNAAHFVHERHLVAELHQKEQEVQTRSGQVIEKEQQVQALTAQVEERQSHLMGLERLRLEQVQSLNAQVAEKEQSVQALTAQVAEKEQSVQALSAQVAEKERAARALNSLLQEIYSSTAWRLIQVLWKVRTAIIPHGSRRERLGHLVVRGLHIWEQEGFRALWRKMIERARSKREIAVGFTPAGQDKGEEDIPQVSIIIPVFNALSLTQECIRSIYRETKIIPFEIIVVDNASTDETPRWLASENKMHSRFEVLRMEQNIGFGPAVNVGIERSRGDFIVILNNDTLVASGWLDNLLAAMDKDSCIGIISPVTNYVGEGPQIDENARELPPNLEAIEQYAKSIENRSDIIYEPNRLVFFCVLLKRDLVNIIGDLDTGYEKGNFEDDDYCLRTRMAGYRLAIARSAFVYHHGSATFAVNKISHSQYMEQNRQRFYSKVGRIATSSRQFISRPVAGSVDVSVIVRTVNRPLLLQRALTSLANQTHSNFEVVVVNDGGEDVSNTINSFRNHLSMTYVYHKSSKGRTAALNAGINRSRGKWLSLLDDDDIFYPWHLEALVQTGENSGYKFIYSDYNKALFLDSSRISPNILVGAPPWEFRRQELLLQNYIPIHTWLLAHECFEKMGPLDTSLDRLEDYEYLLRLSAANDFFHLKKVTCEYRYYLNVSNSIYTDRQKCLDALNYLYQRYPVKDKQLLFKRQENIKGMQKQIQRIEELRENTGISMTEGEVNRAIIRLVVGL